MIKNRVPASARSPTLQMEPIYHSNRNGDIISHRSGKKEEMKRNVQKTLDEFEKERSKHSNPTWGEFYFNDLEQLLKRSGANPSSYGISGLLYDSLRFAFMVGYRYGKREGRQS